MFFRDFFDDEFIRFPLVKNIFNTAVKDMSPCRTVKTDSGYQIILQTVGMNKDDISIELNEDKVLIIKGEKKIEALNFNQNFTRQISLKEIDDIESIDARCEDGLTYIDIKVKKPKTKQIKVSWK